VCLDDLDPSCLSGAVYHTLARSRVIAMNPPVQKGERVVVSGWNNQVTKVADCVYNPQEARWVIILDWGEHGISRVYDHDEGKTWYHYRATN